MTKSYQKRLTDKIMWKIKIISFISLIMFLGVYSSTSPMINKINLLNRVNTDSSVRSYYRYFGNPKTLIEIKNKLNHIKKLSDTVKYQQTIIKKNKNENIN